MVKVQKDKENGKRGDYFKDATLKVTWLKGNMGKGAKINLGVKKGKGRKLHKWKATRKERKTKRRRQNRKSVEATWMKENTAGEKGRGHYKGINRKPEKELGLQQRDPLHALPHHGKVNSDSKFPTFLHRHPRWQWWGAWVWLSSLADVMLMNERSVISLQPWSCGAQGEGGPISPSTPGTQPSGRVCQVIDGDSWRCREDV